jgi:hypothetical protein
MRSALNNTQRLMVNNCDFCDAFHSFLGAIPDCTLIALQSFRDDRFFLQTAQWMQSGHILLMIREDSSRAIAGRVSIPHTYSHITPNAIRAGFWKSFQLHGTVVEA